MSAVVRTPTPAKAKAPAPQPASAAASSAGRGGAVGSGPGLARAGTLLSPARPALGEADLSKGTLMLPAEATDALSDGADINLPVRLPGLAAGEIKLRRRGSHFSTLRDQGIALQHPALAGLSAGTPTVLVLHVVEDTVTGWIGLGLPGPVKGSPHSLFDAMKKSADVLGWAGLSGITIPSVHNEFNNGVIDARAENLAFTVGGFLSGSGSAVLDNKVLAFDGGAKVQIPGGSNGELRINKDASGLLAGRLEIAVSIGKVAGNVTATLTNGFVSVLGGVGYNGDRLSGKLTLVATDEATARDVTLKKPEGGAEVAIDLPGPDKPVKPGKRAFCGWGTLTFQVTDWLAGSATVLVNSQGQATIIGEIAPPKEFILFEQKEWIKRIFKAEIRAGYGIPVVGQVALFANISLDAIAKLGPGKLYQIKLSGAYSTDPRVAKQLTIEGTLNISAFAGLRARAEAGLVVTILAHDIKAGVGLDAIAGVRGYVEAKPRIGMRESAPGKRQYFIQGHLEIAAQPILGFGGDLFVEIETPWWSPLSDKRWTWPLFSLEYPLPGEFGIGADVDYVLGSKQWPKIEFGEVNFDSSKFLTDVMNDNTDKGGGGETKKPGDWKEGMGGGGPGGAKNKGGKGKGPDDPGVDNEPVGTSLTFSDGKESHRMWFQEQPGTAVPMVASEEGPVAQRLAILKTKIPNLMEKDRIAAATLITKAQALLGGVKDQAQQVATMKEAERRVKEAYKKHGDKKGKSKGKKESRKERNKKLKTDEGKLEVVLKDIFSIMRMETWTDVKKPATWSARLHGKSISGKDAVEIVKGESAPKLQTKKALIDLESGPLGIALNPRGREAVKATRNHIHTLPSTMFLEKVPIVGGKVQSRAVSEVSKKAIEIAPEIEKLGKLMKLENLAQGKVIRRPERVWKVKFNVNKTPDEGYEQVFQTEMVRQLDLQRDALNQLTLDTWVARMDTYKSKFHKIFNGLDGSARKAVAVEIRGKLAGIGPLLGQQIASVKAARINLEKFLNQHGDLDKLTLKERRRFSKLAKQAKVAGRSGQETEFAQLHAEGIEEVVAAKTVQNQWEKLRHWQGSVHALLHNADQVAGGHGTIADLKPVKKPVDPATPNEADQKRYADDLKAWEKYKEELSKFVGQKWINSIIGGNWPSRIKELKSEMTEQGYAAEVYGLWRMNVELGHVVVPSIKK